MDRHEQQQIAVKMEAQVVPGMEMWVSLTAFHFGVGDMLEPCPMWLVPGAHTTFQQWHDVI